MEAELFVEPDHVVVPALGTVVGLPSLDFGPAFHLRNDVPGRESRWLYLLLALRDPDARVAVVTSERVEPEVAAYYLDLIPEARDPWSRLALFSVNDLSPRPLAAKLLERPDVIAAIREFGGVVAPFSALSDTDRRLAQMLGLPVLGLDHRFARYEGKSGSRRLLRAAGVPVPDGFEDVTDVRGAVAALGGRAVVKRDYGVTGSGNTVVLEGTPLPELDGGGIVEALIDCAASPSVQARIAPDGSVDVLSIHEQVLDGHAFIGCRYPARGAYVDALREHAASVGRQLAAEGGVGRFALDFVVDREGRAYAVEINPRAGATTHPYETLHALGARFLRASDSVRVPSRMDWRDAVRRVRDAGLAWDPARRAGVVLYMLGALQRSGVISVVALGGSRAEADALFDATAAALDD